MAYTGTLPNKNTQTPTAFITACDAFVAWQANQGDSVIDYVTASTYAVAQKNNIVYKGSATCTVTLPDPTTYAGPPLRFKTIVNYAINSASSNVKPVASDTASTVIVPNTAGKWCDLVPDGTVWVMMSAG